MIAREGLQDLAEVRVQDYREVPEHDFDGICSIGMMEHVGVKNYQSYFEEMFRLLKPMGRLLNHQITISHDKPHGKPVPTNSSTVTSSRTVISARPASSNRASMTPASTWCIRRTCASTTRSPCITGTRTSPSIGTTRSSRSALNAPRYGVCTWAACALNFELDGIQIHQFLAVKPDRVGHPDGKWYPLRQWWQA